MASSDQLKALIESYRDGDDEHFYAVALQMAALEARKGNGRFAEELRLLVESSRRKRDGHLTKPIPLHKLKGELGGLLQVVYPSQRLADLVVDGSVRRQLDTVIREQRHIGRISAHGLSPRRKLLLVGPPGSGKTLTASALAGELGIPLFQVRLDSLITKFMGETAARLRQIFDAICSVRGVYFFDEFDAIGSQRDLSNDVGEARRILNSFLQMLEHDGSHSLILAATNHPGMLDSALLRRFDDVLTYHLPSGAQVNTLLTRRLTGHLPNDVSWELVIEAASGLSFAEVAKAAEDTLKDSLIEDQRYIDSNHLIEMLQERRRMQQSWADK